jgi:hypothetical protein
MGQIGHVQLVAPPRELLGRFTTFGQSDAIVQWLQTQDLQQFDAAIVSIDMLAYGGLVASRVHATPLAQALQRVEIVRQLRQKAPRMKIYGSSVIMRLAPTADGKNEAYREKLSKWAEVSPYPEEKIQTTQLEKEIPADALTDYQQARARNLRLNRLSVDLVKEQVFDYLILSQDDAKPRGIHVRDREALTQWVKNENLGEKIAIQPGTDEVSMLLLARAVSDKQQYHPKIKAVYSTAAVAHQVMPFEDRPLSGTVSFHLKAVGAVEVHDIEAAEVVYFVFATRFEKGSATNFAQEIINFTQKYPQKGIIIADVDPVGDVQGGDVTFTQTLYQKGIFDKIYGYACWNTAGNTIGTALPHGMLFGGQVAAGKQQKSDHGTVSPLRRLGAKPQRWFTTNRLLDDFLYHSLVRPDANKMIRGKGWNPYRLTPEQTREVETYCLDALTKQATSWGIDVNKLSFTLPWHRTFEAEIEFEN